MPQRNKGQSAAPFSHPFMYWVGMDTDPRATPEALAEFNAFYSGTHVHEVIDAHPGFVGVSRFELLDQDPRGGLHQGPRWLSAYAMQDQTAADQYMKDNARPWLHRKRYSPWPAARRKAKTTWRIIWRQLASAGSASNPPESIFLVGMNVPDGTSDTDLADFNRFYTETHVPEVMAYGGYARATRFELFQSFAHPEPGCPRFAAVYEADAAATEQRERRRSSRGQLSSGPPAWEAHDTIWRLVYRRIPMASGGQ